MVLLRVLPRALRASKVSAVVSQLLCACTCVKSRDALSSTSHLGEENRRTTDTSTLLIGAATAARCYADRTSVLSVWSMTVSSICFRPFGPLAEDVVFAFSNSISHLSRSASRRRDSCSSPLAAQFRSSPEQPKLTEFSRRQDCWCALWNFHSCGDAVELLSVMQTKRIKFVIGWPPAPCERLLRPSLKNRTGG